MINFRSFILGLKFALSYFTIIPIKIKDNEDISKNEVLASTLFSLPLIGLILGFITITLFGQIEKISWFGAIICAVSYMILYGFIHTEAIIDVVDAIYAKHSGKDAYTVIKEPTVGAMGVLYTFSFMILKLTAIVYLFLNNYLYEFLTIIIISRLMILVMIKKFEFKSFFVTALKESLTQKTLFISIIVYTALNIYLISDIAIGLMIFAFIFTILISKFIEKNVGFLNGDAIGTTVELNELLLIITFLILF